MYACRRVGVAYTGPLKRRLHLTIMASATTDLSGCWDARYVLLVVGVIGDLLQGNHVDIHKLFRPNIDASLPTITIFLVETSVTWTAC